MAEEEVVAIEQLIAGEKQEKKYTEADVERLVKLALEKAGAEIPKGDTLEQPAEDKPMPLWQKVAYGALSAVGVGAAALLVVKCVPLVANADYEPPAENQVPQGFTVVNGGQATA
jgi:hypothetical protein